MPGDSQLYCSITSHGSPRVCAIPCTCPLPQIWPMVHTELNGAGIKAVLPAEAAKMQKKG